MLERLKGIHRGLLELVGGILFFGLLCMVIGMLLVKEPLAYGIALSIGIVLALITAYHMYKTLDRALTSGRNASKMITSASLIRYVGIFLVLGVILWTDRLNPLVTFMGVMTLKVSAYLQPLTHKFFNKLFHEVDPIPQPLIDDAAEGIVDNKEK